MSRRGTTKAAANGKVPALMIPKNVATVLVSGRISQSALITSFFLSFRLFHGLSNKCKIIGRVAEYRWKDGWMDGAGNRYSFLMSS